MMRIKPIIYSGSELGLIFQDQDPDWRWDYYENGIRIITGSDLGLIFPY